MKHPDRQRVFNALDALSQPLWAQIIEQLEPVVEGLAGLMETPELQRLRAVVQAEHDKD